MAEGDSASAARTIDRVDRPRSVGWRNPGLSCVVSGAAIMLIGVVTAAWSPASGESLLLRWLRVVADHPIRSGMGFYALTASILGVFRPATSDDDPWRGL